jgi:hypothetical protein
MHSKKNACRCEKECTEGHGEKEWGWEGSGVQEETSKGGWQEEEESVRWNVQRRKYKER